jgi:hypothetical protein
MAALSQQPVRLVVQQVDHGGTTTASYRILVYPGRPGMRDAPSVVASRKELVDRLRAAIPDFCEGDVGVANGSTSILFARELDLTDAQLDALGLISK